MAEKAILFKGVELPVDAEDLVPGVKYYAMLREERGSFICTEPQVADENGKASFIFPYELTVQMKGDTNYTLQVVDYDRKAMVSYMKNVVKTVETSLGVEKDIPSVG